MRRRILNYFGEFILSIFKLLFPISVITFITYFIIENFKVGLISNYFDMHWLLIITIISGFILLFFNHEQETYLPFKKVMSILIALIIIFLSYQYLQNMEKMRYLISLLIGISTYLIIIIYPSKYD